MYARSAREPFDNLSGRTTQSVNPEPLRGTSASRSAPNALSRFVTAVELRGLTYPAWRVKQNLAVKAAADSSRNTCTTTRVVALLATDLAVETPYYPLGESERTAITNNLTRSTTSAGLTSRVLMNRRTGSAVRKACRHEAHLAVMD